MTAMPHVADRASWEDAAWLITEYGAEAGDEAAARADRSRDLGNVRHFCRWRQVERLISILARETADGTLH